MTTSNFENLTLDQALDSLQSRIAKLSRPQVAAFFAIAGETLLPLYTRFAQKTGWGDAEVLRDAARGALRYAEGGPSLATSSQILSEIARATPHGEQFDAPDSTFAQDAAICIDAAVRAANPNEVVKPQWVEYALEPAITTLCERQTGYLALGTSRSADEWRSQALRHPELRQAFDALSEMADFLASRGKVIDTAELATLRRLAIHLLPARKPRNWGKGDIHDQ